MVVGRRWGWGGGEEGWWWGGGGGGEEVRRGSGGEEVGKVGRGEEHVIGIVVLHMMNSSQNFLRRENSPSGAYM